VTGHRRRLFVPRYCTRTMSAERVEDAVSGYLMIAEQLGNGKLAGETFNFGWGKPNSALDVVNTIIKVSNHPNLEPIILDEVKNEIKDLSNRVFHSSEEFEKHSKSIVDLSDKL